MDGNGAPLKPMRHIHASERRSFVRRAAGIMLAALPITFLGLFFFYPLLSMLQVSLIPDGMLDLSGFTALITSEYYRRVFFFTVQQAVLSTTITLALAMPTAFVFARFDFPGKSLLLSLATLPFVLPTVVVAAAFGALIGERGVINTTLVSLFGLSTAPVQLEGTLTIILIAHAFYNYSVALRIIGSYWATLSPRMDEAARVLGAHGWRLWWTIRLPALRPAILAAAALVFVFTFTSFGVVLILGGIRFATLEVEIFNQARNLFNLNMAAALSLTQIGFMFIVMLVYTRLSRAASADLQAARAVARKPRTTGEKALVWMIVVAMSIFQFAPLLALVWRSFTVGDQGFTTRSYAALSTNPRGSVLFAPPLEAIGNSITIALVTTVLAVSLGMLTAYLLERRDSWVARALDAVFMLPLATSAVTLGFGFIIALDEPPLNLRASPLMIPLAHTLVALPFVVRSILPGLRSISPSIRGAAAVMGASPFTVWRTVDLPLISRGVIVGAVFAFTISMGEFGASLFIARPDTPTIPIVIYRLLGQPGAGNYGQALAMSVILMSVCALSFIVIERLRKLGMGEF